MEDLSRAEKRSLQEPRLEERCDHCECWPSEQECDGCYCHMTKEQAEDMAAEWAFEDDRERQHGM